jgi:molybdenum cofactor guanylyltransferase
MLDVEGFILVGGESSRMGKDKSRLLVNGKTTVSLITEALRPVTTSIRLVGSHLEPTDSLLNIPDLQYKWGPLGGIQAALRAGRTKFCVVVACDLPFVTTELFARLLSFREASEACDAIVPRQEDGRPQPLCAVYQREPCLPATENAIADNQHSPRALLDRVRTRYIPFNELTDLRGSDHFFFNLNRPEDFERAKQIAGRSGPTS